jgi:hypothetical protein
MKVANDFCLGRYLLGVDQIAYYKNSRPNFRCAILHGLLVLSLALCLSSVDQAIAEPVGSVSQPLVLNGSTVLWTQNGNLVPMCWHQLLQFPNTNAENDAKAFVAQTIQDGWISLLNLRISWVDCPTSGGAQHVRVKLRTGDSGYGGTTLQVGMATLSTAAQRVVPPPNDPPGLLMGFRTDWNQNDQTRANFRSLILHEFGHVLGFDHEQVRTDGPPGVSCYSNTLSNAIRIGPPDPRSIMGWSYCTEALGALSPDDIRGARSVYGTGHSGSNDFNNDGRGDILWHNASTGETQIWFMSGSSRVGRATVDAVRDGGGDRVGLPWSIVGTNDFNQDRATDILWHNASTGETQIWFMSGSSRIGRATVDAVRDGGGDRVGLPWSIVGTNDFNQDRATDILWHNASTGETQIWFMSGSSRIGRATVDAVRDGGGDRVGLPWSIMNH